MLVQFAEGKLHMQVALKGHLHEVLELVSKFPEIGFQKLVSKFPEIGFQIVGIFPDYLLEYFQNIFRILGPDLWTNSRFIVDIIVDIFLEFVSNLVLIFGLKQ